MLVEKKKVLSLALKIDTDALLLISNSGSEFHR